MTSLTSLLIFKAMQHRLLKFCASVKSSGITSVLSWTKSQKTSYILFSIPRSTCNLGSTFLVIGTKGYKGGSLTPMLGTTFEISLSVFS